MRRCLYCVLVLATVLGLPAAYAEGSGGKAPLNPAFEAWRKNQANRRDLDVFRSPAARKPSPFRITGKRPAPLNLRHLYNQSIVPVTRKAMDTGGSLPERFDLRESHRITEVKDQAPWGTCWSFAALGSAESSALGQGWQTADFSEKHLAYFAYTDINDRLVGFDLNPEDSLYEQGANAPVPIAMLSRWTGIVAEQDAPYKDFDTAPSATSPNTALLHKTLFAPSGEHFVKNVKYLIHTGGAANIDVYIDRDVDAEDGDPTLQGSFNPETGAFYYTGDATGGNHAVLAVGWDDHYSKDNFLQPPPENGAWIVQNSWGEEWGDDGYFYVSYYDAYTGKHEGEDAYAYGITSIENYDIIHFYDVLGITGTYAKGGDNSSQWYSNIFLAEEDQNIKAAGIYVLNPNTQLSFSVYTGTEAGRPISGNPVFGPWEITKEIPGYYVVDFERDILVEKNQSFSIVVHARTPAGEFPIAIEGPEEKYSSKAQAEKGQSFVSADGQIWQDMTEITEHTNVCLKALGTRKAPPEPDPPTDCFIRTLIP